MRINRQLIWDYEADKLDFSDEAVERWYVERVLTRGGIDDVKAVGLARIKEHLPHLRLPPRVREFWDWYLPLEISRGNPDAPATASAASDR